MMTQKVLVVGPKTNEMKILMDTLTPSEHHKGKLVSHFSRGVLDLNVYTTHYTTEELCPEWKKGEIDVTSYDGLLLVFPTYKLPGLADLDQYTDLVKSMSSGKEKLHIGVCYLVPEGGQQSEPCGEVDLLEAKFFQTTIQSIQDGSVSYDSVLEKVFEDVLQATYSKRPARKMRKQAEPIPNDDDVILIVKKSESSPKDYVEHD
jgi:hypothetical protein